MEQNWAVNQDVYNTETGDRRKRPEIGVRPSISVFQIRLWVFVKRGPGTGDGCSVFNLRFPNPCVGFYEMETKDRGSSVFHFLF